MGGSFTVNEKVIDKANEKRPLQVIVLAENILIIKSFVLLVILTIDVVIMLQCPCVVQVLHSMDDGFSQSYALLCIEDPFTPGTE